MDNICQGIKVKWRIAISAYGREYDHALLQMNIKVRLKRTVRWCDYDSRGDYDSFCKFIPVAVFRHFCYYSYGHDLVVRYSHQFNK